MSRHCGNGHDLGLPAAVTSTNRCRACMYARQARYSRTPKGRARTQGTNARYKATRKGMLADLRSHTRTRIRRSEARVAELEMMLNA